MTSIRTSLNNISSSHKANNDCCRIVSNQDISQTTFLREKLKNKNTINVLLENVFSNNECFPSYDRVEDNYKINVKKKINVNIKAKQKGVLNSIKVWVFFKKKKQTKKHLYRPDRIVITVANQIFV